jgi:hypothetical protein
MAEAITIRRSNGHDVGELRRLALLDDRAALHGDALLGYVNGELRAAVELGGRRVVANPFVRTAELVELLRARVAQRRL